jgi:hypothetical protein
MKPSMGRMAGTVGSGSQCCLIKKDLESQNSRNIEKVC